MKPRVWTVHAFHRLVRDAPFVILTFGALARIETKYTRLKTLTIFLQAPTALTMTPSIMSSDEVRVGSAGARACPFASRRLRQHRNLRPKRIRIPLKRLLNRLLSFMCTFQ